MDLSENEKFKIGEQFSFQNYARLNSQKCIIYHYYFIEVITVNLCIITVLYLNVLATIAVLCWRSSDATGLKCDGASLNHFLLLYHIQNKNHLKTPCNETSPSQWVSSLGLANLSLFFVKKCQFPSMIPSHFVGVIYRLLLQTISSLSWRLQMTQHLWGDDANPWEDLKEMKLTLNKHTKLAIFFNDHIM